MSDQIKIKAKRVVGSENKMTTEARHWLKELRKQYLERLDEVNKALDTMTTDDIFEVSNNPTSPIDRTIHHLAVTVEYLDKKDFRPMQPSKNMMAQMHKEVDAFFGAKTKA